jgi:uncharacterized membrane protein YdbT with pleckstrin-like domain
MAEAETVLWEGHPSQWTNLGIFLACLLILPIPFAFARWLQTRCFSYKVTTERVIMTRGVFSRRSDELELYRVKDTTLLQPFWLRLVGLAHIVLTTSDRTTPILQLTAIPGAETLREQLRANIERMRQLRGVRETDVGEVVR